MRAKKSMLGSILILAFLGVTCALPSHADGRGNAGRAIRHLAKNRFGGNLSRGHGGYNVDALRELGRLMEHGRGGHGHEFNNFGNWYGYDRHHDYHDADREYAKAMRDAAIANAVVGMVGVIANSAAAANAPYAAPPAYAPAPYPVYAPPARQYVTERVLVRRGGYQEFQEWVPDRYDTHTGETIMGHYETRRSYVPDVYEERLVPVAP